MTERAVAPIAQGQQRQFRLPRWCGPDAGLLAASLLAGASYFATAFLTARLESENPAVLTNALAAALSVVAIMRLGRRVAVAIGIAALAFGVLMHAAPWEPSALAMLCGLATICAVHPLLCASIARRYLLGREDVSTARALCGLLLVGPVMSLAAALLAGCLIITFADLSAGQMLAVLVKWWVVSAILIPLTVAVGVATRTDASQSLMLSIEHMLPALATASFLITLLVAVRHMQLRDEVDRIASQLREVATDDISQLTTGARWKGGVESLLAIQDYRFDMPAMDHYVASVSDTLPGLVAIGWAPWTAATRRPAGRIAWAGHGIPGGLAPPPGRYGDARTEAAMLEAARSGTARVLDESVDTAGSAKPIFTSFHAVYPARFGSADATPAAREVAALGVLIARFELHDLFSRTREFAEAAQGQVAVVSADGTTLLTVGSPLPGRPMRDDIQARADVAAGPVDWTVTFRKRAEIASIADVRPSEIALSVISLLLGLGMAYATLDTVRRRREIEREVRRRTVKLARQIRSRRRAEKRVRSAQDQLKSVFSAIPIPTLLVDIESGRIVDCNASTHELSGLATPAMVGKALADVGLPSLQVLAEVGTDGGELEMATPAGTRRYVVTSRNVLVDRRQAMVICFGDVTRLHEVESGLRSANEMLEMRVAARTAELDASRRQIRAAMDNSPVGLAMVALDGHWLDFNDAICRILGYSRDELSALDVYQISHPEDVGVTTGHVNGLLDGLADACCIEKRYIRKDGQVVWVQLDIAVVSGEHNEPLHFVAQIQDITEKRRRAEELRQAAADLESLNDALARERESLAVRVAERTAELQQANEVLKLATDKATQASRAKTEFVAVMSHEIRTPLNGVIGALDILQASPMRADQSELVSMGVEAARSLLAIVDDILDFSRIEAGMIQLDDSEFALEERLAAAVECMLPMARRLDAELTVWVDPELPGRVLGDEIRMQQVLRNLIANALKFSTGPSRKGSVAVRAKLLARGAGNRALARISVQDNGIGMSEAAVARLFQPFTQVDQSTTRRFGGSGLGLSICAKLASLMGGRIEVSSRPGAGSTFTFDIPLEVTVWSSGSTRLRGLSVEMMGKDVESLGDLLASLRAHGATTGPGGEASVTVVDVPSSDGDPLQALLEREGKDAGIVLLTRNGPRRGEIAAPGVVTLDRQALSMRNLMDAVLLAVGRCAHHSDSGTPLEPAPAGERPLILLVEDNPVNQAVVQRQLEMLGFQVAVAPDGEAGFAMWRQLHPAIILTDLHMPVMDGYGMVQRMLSVSGGTVPPIIALTADASTNERNKCLAAGMSGYITKPVRAQVLKTVLDKWLVSQPGRPPEATDTRQPGKAMHYSILEELACRDPKLIRRILETFAAMADETTERLRTALRSSDWARLGEEAHKFKSSARTVGAVRLGELCELLERNRNHCDLRTAGSAVEDICAEVGRVLAEVAVHMDRKLEATG